MTAGTIEKLLDTISSLQTQIDDLTKEVKMYRGNREADELTIKALQGIREKTIEECAKVVEDHWNDLTYMCNQHDQAQRSAKLVRSLTQIDRGHDVIKPSCRSLTPKGKDLT